MLIVIINHALFKVEQSKTRLILHIEEMDLSFISDIDLTTIFANFLDNAIEACRTLSNEKREIQFYIEQKMGFYLFHISNSYESIQPITHKKYKSMKNGHAGIGLSNVKQAVNKYQGIFDIDTSDHTFTVSITIPEYPSSNDHAPSVLESIKSNVRSDSDEITQSSLE